MSTAISEDGRPALDVRQEEKQIPCFARNDNRIKFGRGEGLGSDVEGHGLEERFDAVPNDLGADTDEKE